MQSHHIVFGFVIFGWMSAAPTCCISVAFWSWYLKSIWNMQCVCAILCEQEQHLCQGYPVSVPFQPIPLTSWGHHQESSTVALVPMLEVHYPSCCKTCGSISVLHALLLTGSHLSIRLLWSQPLSIMFFQLTVLTIISQLYRSSIDQVQ